LIDQINWIMSNLFAHDLILKSNYKKSDQEISKLTHQVKFNKNIK
jgi:hypothetical protein